MSDIKNIADKADIIIISPLQGHGETSERKDDTYLGVGGKRRSMDEDEGLALTGRRS